MIRMPTTPIILVHSLDPETGLTRCGGVWPGDVFRGYRGTPRFQCPGCHAALEQALFPPKVCECKRPVLCRSDIPRG